MTDKGVKMAQQYYECMDKVIEQIRWSYKIGTIGTIDMDTCGEIAEQVLTEDEYMACTEYANGFIAEIYQNV